MENLKSYLSVIIKYICLRMAHLIKYKIRAGPVRAVGTYSVSLIAFRNLQG